MNTMYVDTLAKIRVNEALKMGMEAQRIRRELHGDGNEGRRLKLTPLSNRFQEIRRSILKYWEKLYCGTLELLYSRS